MTIAVEPPPILELAHMSKRFPGVRALHDVRLNLRPGEVMALLGENGAGKSTLVKILTGIYTPDSGTLHVEGQPRSFSSPTDAWAAGITAIHQEIVMFDELSVTENIFMCHMPTRLGRIDWSKMYEDAAALLARLDADFSPHTLLKRLGVAQKHLVEIARALSHDARIIIMDEPTAALSSARLPRMKSEALSAIIMVEALRLAEIIRGMTDASITRRPSRPCTRSRSSTTAQDVSAGPIRQVQPGWNVVVPRSVAAARNSSSVCTPGPGKSSCA